MRRCGNWMGGQTGIAGSASHCAGSGRLGAVRRGILWNRARSGCRGSTADAVAREVRESLTSLLAVSAIPELNCELAVAFGLLEMIRRRQIRDVRGESDAFDPAQHLEQFAMLRIFFGQHAFEDVGGRVVDE